MDIIQKFMEEYQQALAAYDAGDITAEQLYEKLMTLRSRAHGLVKRVRSAHFQLLANIIADEVDRKTEWAASKSIGLLPISANQCPMPTIDIQLMINKVHAEVEAILHAKYNVDLTAEQKPTRAVVAPSGDHFDATVFVKDFVLYVLPFHEVDRHAVCLKSNDAVALEYNMRAGMMDPRLQWGK